ncbi:hypothetical protein FOBRF1_011564 [Fusarium oxysporum]
MQADDEHEVEVDTLVLTYLYLGSGNHSQDGAPHTHIPKAGRGVEDCMMHCTVRSLPPSTGATCDCLLSE